MDATPFEKIALWAGGKLATGDPQGTASVVCTDSRALKAGDLFVALRGDKFDGHTFVAEASKRGAAGAIVEEFPAELPTGFAVVLVKDTLQALQLLATEYRRSLDLQVIGLTGSNGKTSTKDLTAAVLGENFQVTKTEGNLNNHIGVPLTLLRARGADQMGVFEMGMNHAGEIAPLAAMAAPEVGIITNVGMAHIEFLGSKDAIAQEKGMLAEALPPSGTLILNANDEFSASIAARTRADVVLAGIDTGEVFATNLRVSPAGTKFTLNADGRTAEAELAVPGKHMVSNAMLAVAAGRVFGLSLEECAAGLTKLRLTKGRLEQKMIRGIQVIDDTYNANPDSVAAALRTLASMPAVGRRIAVLGRMGELGTEAERGHRMVGEVAAQVHLDNVIGVGEDAQWITDAAWRGGVEKVVRVESTEEATKVLRDLAKAGDLVLIKGSRSARMERIVEGLLAP
ncbi:MAG: UDP-N-acetylmuramoyl-tripeptide--D-alanyl-D-alanine ligase [Chthoniobacter sp.]|uniref:UDP-N-acetylmuramoyl-tripeptide--D-alanyl-D- alanine ligase n=1 Tax=Chthoniobacter sp. TaxID=2510640 RepID=UPI0032A86EED